VAPMNETSLIQAAKRGDIAAVEAALAAGVPIDARDPTGATALWYAAWLGHSTVTERLLAAGANPDGHDPVAIERHAGDGQVVSIWSGLPDTAHPGPAASRRQGAGAELGARDDWRRLPRRRPRPQRRLLAADWRSDPRATAEPMRI
jgi:Ankyrin repeats (3 copies)